MPLKTMELALAMAIEAGALWETYWPSFGVDRALRGLPAKGNRFILPLNCTSNEKPTIIEVGKVNTTRDSG